MRAVNLITLSLIFIEREPICHGLVTYYVVSVVRSEMMVKIWN